VGWSRDGRVVERRRVDLWEPNGRCAASLENFSIRQSDTTSSTVAFPAPTSEILFAFLLAPLELAIAEIIEDRGK
jgi:hypothetical protein